LFHKYALAVVAVKAVFANIVYEELTANDPDVE
jgi:hypothetical protein